MTHLLEKKIQGRGEVSGVVFTQVYKDGKYYIYERSDNCFELFERRKTSICIDFKNRIFSDFEFKEYYPKSNSFGIWAWTFNTLQMAKDKLLALKNVDK